jgi:penicillin-binding protein 1A
LTLRQTLDTEGKDLDVSEGAVVVLDTSGGIKALIGGRSYRSSPFDRAVKALRQPGSAFKPFVYLTALESGYTPDSIANDEPVAVDGWSPKNHSGTYRGAVTLRDSFAQSINTVAVKLADDVGRGNVVSTARRLGIRSELHDRPSLALGTAEVTPLELVARLRAVRQWRRGHHPAYHRPRAQRRRQAALRVQGRGAGQGRRSVLCRGK